MSRENSNTSVDPPRSRSVDQRYHGAAMKNILLLSLCVAAWPASASAQAIQALGIFEQRCGSCHTKPAADSRAPDRDSLRQRTPEAVFDALTTGSMKVNAEGLTDAQKRMIAEFITERPLGAALAGQASAMPNRCASKPIGALLTGPAWNGWGVDAGNTRFQPAAAAGLTADQVPKLKLKWAFGFPNGTSAYGQPTIAGGRVFVGSDNGFVYSLDAATGCVYWSFQSSGGVRTAISLGRAGARLRRVLRRREGERLRRRRRDRRAAVDEERRIASAGADHRRAGAVQRASVRACRVVRRRLWTESEVRMLHVPRIGGRVRRRDRRAGVEDLHDSRTAAPDEEEFDRDAVVWTGRCRRLVGADDRREAGRALRRHRRRLHVPGGRDERCDRWRSI